MEIEKTIYLVRHGQSDDNVAPVFQATTSPLSETGKRQAERIAERVSNLSFDALIASPLQRAKQTAEAIGRKTGRAIEFNDLFVERIKPTCINGKLHADEKASAVCREWEKSIYTPEMRVEDGENFDDLLTRADKVLDFLQNRTEKSLVVVTHGYFLRTIVARVLLGNILTGESFKNFHSSAGHENTGLTVLRYSAGFEEAPKWRLWIYNDHAHLAE